MYLDPRYPGMFKYGNLIFDYKPVYVGKGSKKWKRKFVHLKRSNNKRLKNLIHNLYYNNLKPIIITVYDNLIEEDSLSKEMELIKLVGRIDTNTGPLFNLTDGGDGHSGLILTNEQRAVRRCNTTKFWQSLTVEQRKEIGKKSKQNRSPENIKAGIQSQRKTNQLKSAAEKKDIENRRFKNWQKSLAARTNEQKQQLSAICKYASTKLRKQYLVTIQDIYTGENQSKFLLDWLKDGFARDGIMYRIKNNSTDPLYSRTTKKWIKIISWEKISPASVS